MGGSMLGLSAPFTNPVQQLPWGISPYGTPGLNINPFALQGQPFTNLLSGSPIGYGVQPLQQVLQLLQIVPQQLQQLEHLQFQQIQQLQQVQQLVQLIPAQLGQLHQLLQLSRQGQQPLQFQQPFGQASLGSHTLTPPWGISPQIFGAQPSHVM